MELAKLLGPEKSKALPVFNAFSGCDYVSQFLNIVEKTAWNRWGVYPDVTSAFLSLVSALKEVKEEHIQKLERYVVLLYDRTSNKQSLDKARRDLCTNKLRY